MGNLPPQSENSTLRLYINENNRYVLEYKLHKWIQVNNYEQQSFGYPMVKMHSVNASIKKDIYFSKKAHYISPHENDPDKLVYLPGSDIVWWDVLTGEHFRDNHNAPVDIRLKLKYIDINKPLRLANAHGAMPPPADYQFLYRTVINRFMLEYMEHMWIQVNDDTDDYPWVKMRSVNENSFVSDARMYSPGYLATNKDGNVIVDNYEKKRVPQANFIRWNMITGDYGEYDRMGVLQMNLPHSFSIEPIPVEVHAPVKVHPNPLFRELFVCTNQELLTLPPLDVLRKITRQELEQVLNFTVVHKRWGNVQFEGRTNILGLNISEAIRFGHGEVIVETELYPMLNRPAVVTLREITAMSWSYEGKPKPVNFLKPDVVAATTVKLRAQCDLLGVTFISYDGDTWMFRVENWPPPDPANRLGADVGEEATIPTVPAVGEDAIEAAATLNEDIICLFIGAHGNDLYPEELLPLGANIQSTPYLPVYDNINHWIFYEAPGTGCNNWSYRDPYSLSIKLYNINKMYNSNRGRFDVRYVNYVTHPDSIKNCHSCNSPLLEFDIDRNDQDDRCPSCGTHIGIAEYTRRRRITTIEQNFFRMKFEHKYHFFNQNLNNDSDRETRGIFLLYSSDNGLLKNPNYPNVLYGDYRYFDSQNLIKRNQTGIQFKTRKNDTYDYQEINLSEILHQLSLWYRKKGRRGKLTVQIYDESCRAAPIHKSQLRLPFIRTPSFEPSLHGNKKSRNKKSRNKKSKKSFSLKAL